MLTQKNAEQNAGLLALQNKHTAAEKKVSYRTYKVQAN